MSTFNRASLLPHAVERLVGQHTTVPYEVILVNNNSTDGTASVLEELVARHPTLLRGGFEGRQGVSHGRNTGIALSRAPIVAFTDDDVQVAPDWVERIATELHVNQHVDCVGGRVLPVWSVPPPRWITRNHWSPLALVDYGDEPLEVDYARPLCLVTANVAYRRSALDVIGWFSPEFRRCQDHELLLRLWDAGRRGLYVPQLVATCEVPATRLTWSYHRQWHATHGRFCAHMRDGRAAPHGGPAGGHALTLFGSPATVYRGLVTSVRDYVVAILLWREAQARTAETSIRHRLAFVRERARLWRRGQRTIRYEIRQFLSAWLAKRRTQMRQVAARRG